MLAAETVSDVFSSDEGITAFSALVLTESDMLSRKAELHLDEYITLGKRTINLMIDWGIPAQRLHLVEISEHTIEELCDTIETFTLQWKDLVQKIETPLWN